jgi:hypothetical protein
MATGIRGTRWSGIPGGRDDVIERVKEDMAKAKKGRDVDSSKLSGTAKEIVREAGQRATNRNIGRGGAAVAALEAGAAIGREIDENGIPFTGGVGKGIGKKIVDKSGLGDAVEKAVKRRDKVELSKGSKERLEDMDTDRVMREVDADIEASKYAKKDKHPTEYRGDDEYKRGGRVKKMASGGMTASKRADGIATRGKTRCKMY